MREIISILKESHITESVLDIKSKNEKESKYPFRLIFHESIKYVPNVKRTRPEEKEYICQPKKKNFFFF